MSAEPGSYTQYPSLEGLPPLVRKQRRLESRIAPIEPLIEEEKALRKEIDGLLLQAGLTKGEGVTCLGYDVTHRERAGQKRLNQDALTARLVGAGLELAVVITLMAECTEEDDPAKWADVKPCKGSKVRT